MNIISDCQWGFFLAVYLQLSSLLLFHILPAIRQNRAVIRNDNKTTIFAVVCLLQCLAPPPPPPLGMSSAATNATGAMQHGEVCATAWWSVLFILKWGCSSGRHRGGMEQQTWSFRDQASVGGLVTAKWQLLIQSGPKDLRKSYNVSPGIGEGAWDGAHTVCTLP